METDNKSFDSAAWLVAWSIKDPYTRRLGARINHELLHYDAVTCKVSARRSVEIPVDVFKKYQASARDYAGDNAPVFVLNALAYNVIYNTFRQYTFAKAMRIVFSI